MSRDVDRIVETMDTLYFGKYRAVVKSTDDKTKCGMVKVRVPAVMGEKEVWAWPCVPYAGKKLGFFAIPPEGTSVWCEFEGGSISTPIWSGCFWKKGEIDSADAKASVFFLKTPGVTLRVDNDSGEVVIESSSGAKITLSKDGITVKATKFDVGS